MQTVDGRLVIIGGKSRSGKTAYTRQAVRSARRICAWDPEDQWAQLPGWKRITTREDLKNLAMHQRGPFKAAFVVAGKNLKADFDYWSEAMLYAGKYIAPLVCIAEELASVAPPGKAPGSWGDLLRMGLKRGIDIYAISQRWAEADKTALGNASEFVLFAQSSADDVRYLTKKTRVPGELIDRLQQLEYIRYDPDSRKYTQSKLKF